MQETPISIGCDRQLLLDRRLIDELQDARQVLHQPVRTGPAELSLYMTEHWRLPTSCIRRLTLRLDGFASVQAPYGGGRFITKPLIFSGDQLRLNMSTSAAGSIRVEVQDENGRPFPGLSLADSAELFQDQTDLAVQWKSGAGVGPLAGRPVRLRFVMYDADLYALRFCARDEE